VYLGDGTDCATVDCSLQCVRPPRGLTAWWPLDDATSGVTPNLAAPSAGGTLLGSPTNVPGSYVTGSYMFDGVDDNALVSDDPSVDLGTSDFSIDFWIKTTDGQGLNAILDKRSAQPLRGYRMFLQDGYPGLSMSDGSVGSYVLSAANGGPAAYVADGNWHFVVVTVDRNNVNGVQFWVDGIPVGTTFNPTAESGSLDNNADLVIGQNYTIISTGGFFTGNLDELEIFRRVISPQDISDIHRAGTAGKCREACYASQKVVCCDGEGSGAITICNYDVVPHLYSYGLSPLTGPGCPGLGVTSFAPNGGTVTVGPGECLTIPIEMMCPTDVPIGTQSCFEAFIYNHDTGANFGCTGSVRKPAWWCIKWDVASQPLKGLLPITAQNTVAVNLFIKHIPVLNPAPVDFDYEIWPMENDGTTPSGGISLDGLPPGEPIVRTVKIPPEGIDLPLNVRVEAVQPVSFQKMVLMGDEDMDGKLEPLAEFGVVSNDGSTTGIDDREEPGDGTTLRPFLALPNPFSASGKISFKLTGEKQPVSLQLFDLRGREIKRFFRKRLLEPGVHDIYWKRDNGYGVPLPSGVYFLRLSTEDFEDKVKVVIMR
ncbi:MAG: hypothetical protein HKN21_07220, partial [Candidatus Eisenbacteria bacterium]|nr:hypothetical protein [Candidatus Eisenbacteria bacterium]